MTGTGFQFNEWDAEIVHDVYQLRLGTLDHLAALTNRSYKTLERRVPKLREGHYLIRLQPRPHKGIYVIGPEAVPVLIEHGYAPADLVRQRLRRQELSEIGLRHSLFIADIHARLILATRGGPITLTHWAEGPSLWDSVAPRAGEAALPIRPDAHLILKHAAHADDKNLLHIFLEADRSTMAHTRMAAKIVGYLAYYEQRLHRKKYPSMRSFVVATVTETRRRAEELRRDLDPLIPRAARYAYRFIPFEDLTLPALLPKAATH